MVLLPPHAVFEGALTTFADIHFYEPSKGHGLAHDPFNAIIAPRPIAWVSTIGRDGVPNLAPFSFSNAFSYHPPIVGFTCTGQKGSLTNARDTGEFVWNLVTHDTAAQMNVTSAVVPHGENEFALAGLAPRASRIVAPPCVDKSPVNLECKVCDIVQMKSFTGEPAPAWLVLGEVVAVHIRRDLVREGVFDTFGANIVVRAGGPSAYALLKPDSRFDMARPK